MHRCDIIHRDLKPSNIVLEDENNLSSAKIVDFGQSSQLTAANRNLVDDCNGTLVYQAPEQALAETNGKPADVWACGFIMFEMLNGRHPLYEHGENKPSYK